MPSTHGPASPGASLQRTSSRRARANSTHPAAPLSATIDASQERCMRRVAFVIVQLIVAATLAAQPRLTLDYPAIATRLVQQLALKPGERVLSIAHPGVFEDLQPYIRYEVMRAGGVDLGVVEVLREPVPESFDAAVMRKGAQEAREHYKAMFRDV